MSTEVPAGAGAPESVEAVTEALAAHGYLADEGLATSVFLALALRRPLLLEGEAGVGKTEVAKVLAAWSGAELIRLQCYEGIDVSQAVYEWDYARQLLHLRAAEIAGAARLAAGAAGVTDGAAGVTVGAGVDAAGADHAAGGGELTDAVYSERFLVRRALLAAVDHGGGPPPVLLIDEVDRADDEFEAFLLEILSEYAVTVPELGTFRAAVPPRVVITSNRTRDVHDALKRRCLYHWVPHPDFEREVEIVALRAPQAVERLVRQVAGAVESLRGMHLYKPPGVAESIDWAAALAALGRREIDEHAVDVTLGAVVKYQEDQARVRAAGLDELVRAAVLRGA
jgi:MoxR-like ATPase